MFSEDFIPFAGVKRYGQWISDLNKKRHLVSSLTSENGKITEDPMP